MQDCWILLFHPVCYSVFFNQRTGGVKINRCYSGVLVIYYLCLLYLLAYSVFLLIFFVGVHPLTSLVQSVLLAVSDLLFLSKIFLSIFSRANLALMYFWTGLFHGNTFVDFCNFLQISAVWYLFFCSLCDCLICLQRVGGNMVMDCLISLLLHSHMFVCLSMYLSILLLYVVSSFTFPFWWIYCWLVPGEVRKFCGLYENFQWDIASP